MTLSFISSLSRRYPILDFARFVVRQTIELKMTRVAASLTFTMLLAIVPFFTVALIVLSAFPVFSDFKSRFQHLVFGALVPEYVEKVGDYLNAFISNVGNLTAPGLIVLAVVALMLLRTIEDAFNGIWCVKKSRPLRLQLLVYWMILTLGPLLIGIGFTLWRWINHSLPMTSSVHLPNVVLQHTNSLIVTTLFLLLMYRFVPNRAVRLRHAFFGAITAAIFIEIARVAFSWYVNKIASYQLIYGAFASLPVFLLWLYCLWLIVLAGAIVAASMSYWRGAAWRRVPDFRRNFQDAIEILLILYEEQKKGGSISVTKLRRILNVADEQLYYLLDELAQKGFVQQGGEQQGDTWVLKMSAEHLKLSDVMRIFIDGQPFNPGAEIEQKLGRLLQPLFDSLNVSLKTFSEQIKQEHGC
ncbi:MAG: YihY family inner membrane protein [Burkholderiales bacterium]|jgi:membrane protein|nr:YihY family inner membrane protein [Burkholderiales bacterium]